MGSLVAPITKETNVLLSKSILRGVELRSRAFETRLELPYEHKWSSTAKQRVIRMCVRVIERVTGHEQTLLVSRVLEPA